MSIWNEACHLLKSIDDEDDVEKADDLSASNKARIGVADEFGAKALTGQKLKKVKGAGGKGLVHNRAGTLTITDAPAPTKNSSREDIRSASPFRPIPKR